MASAMRRVHGRRQWIGPDDDDESVKTQERGGSGGGGGLIIEETMGWDGNCKKPLWSDSRLKLLTAVSSAASD